MHLCNFSIFETLTKNFTFSAGHVSGRELQFGLSRVLQGYQRLHFKIGHYSSRPGETAGNFIRTKVFNVLLSTAI